MRISNHFLKKLGNTSKSCQKCNFTWIFTISVRPYLQKLLRYDMMLRHGNTVYTYIFSNIYWKLCILLKKMYFFTKKMYLFVYHITSFLKKMVGITHFRHSYVLPLFLQALKKKKKKKNRHLVFLVMEIWMLVWQETANLRNYKKLT